MKYTMIKSIFNKKTLLALGLCCSPLVNAINVNLFEQSHSPDFTYTEDSLRKYSIFNEKLIFSAFYQYNDDPLITTNQERTQQRSTLIESYHNLSLNAAVLTSSRFLIGVNTSVNQVFVNNGSEESVTQNSLGDTNLTLKHRFTPNRSKYSMAIMGKLELPTGDEEAYLSNTGVGVGGKFIVERDFKLFKLAGNLGYVYNPKAKLEDLDYTKRLLLSLGAHVPLWGDKLALNIEGTTARTFPLNSYQNPGEVYTGVNYKVNKEWMLSGGTSFGNIKVGGLAKAQSNDFRILGGIKFIPNVQRTQNLKFLSKNLTKEQQKIIKDIVQINDEIKFHHDSHLLTESGKRAVAQIAELLKSEDQNFSSLLIEGHANEVGAEDYNEKLSFNRANTVKKYLINNGVSEQKLVPVGHGESKPKKLDLDHEKLLELNRRVEFRIN